MNDYPIEPSAGHRPPMAPVMRGAPPLSLTGGEWPRPRAERATADRALAERMLASVRAGRDVRGRKVRRLRAAIKVRAYENDLKLAVAVQRMGSVILGPPVAGDDER